MTQPTDWLEQAKREIAEELKALKDAISDIGHFHTATCDDGITNERDPDNCQRCYLDQEFEAAEQFTVAERARNLELRAAADEAMRLTGHLTTCNFTGCTCGATEQFKTARLDYFRVRGLSHERD